MERRLRELRVGFVGAGRMAAAVAQALLLAGEVPPANIFASAPSNRNLEKFQNLDCKTTHSNLEVVENSTFIFLATKPHVLPAVLREIAPAVHSHHVVISMAAGVTLQTLEEMLPAGTKVLRIMPNLPCTVQSGAIVLARGSFAGEEEASLLKKLLSPCGLCEEGPESYIDIHTGLSGSGVAYSMFMKMASTKRKCKFSNTMKSKFPCFVEGRNENEAKCTICDSYLSVAHKGATDLERHIESEKHRNLIKVSASSNQLTYFFQSKHSAKMFQKVHAAEATLAFHTVCHHQSYNSMTCTAGLMHTLFEDSEIAKNIACAKTKTEAIINQVIAPHTVDQLVKSLRGISCFGLSTDASNHGSQKLFPIIVQYFDWKAGGIQTKILALDSTPNETSETISQYILRTLQRYDLSSQCVAFVGDNANVNFGGINRRDGKNVFSHLKEALSKPLVGVGCPAHVLHNCIQHGTDLMQIDVETVVLKIFNYFSVYTIRTETLKDFCDYVDISYQQLLYHSKTRWLSLFPAVERLLRLFTALKEYFLSVNQPPAMIKKIFENDFSEIYLWFLHSLMSIFQVNIAAIEREETSVLEVMHLLHSTLKVLKGRLKETFISLKVREMLRRLKESGREEECNSFMADVGLVYEACISYLEKWMKPFDEFQCFDWMYLSKIKDRTFDDVLTCISYLKEKGITVDDVQLFDQYCNLKSFVQDKNEQFFERLLHEQWSLFFQSCPNASCFSELLKICELFFCIPGHNGNVERVFSLINAQWTKERNRLLVESVKGIIFTKYNLKNITCEQFYAYVIANEDLLQKVGSSEKYVV